ncbi:MAG TPA: CHAP domain-containing protein [Allosphingosinicella sp.]|jgi:surface antigen|nr:CHAP domain-containing protein [Allosphingosinicella sp.]
MKRIWVTAAVAAGVMSSVASAAITTTELAYRRIECVIYVREIVKSLPYGLTYWADKKRIINSYTCKAGSVAIIQVPSGAAAQYGHMAYVDACGTTGITIREANFRKDTITRRVATPNILQAEKELRIVGYWRPK